MSRHRTIALTLALATMPAFSAHAAGTRPQAWVSAAIGVDGPSCGGFTSPCRFFQYVLDNIVARNGSVNVRDPGTYGAMQIAFPVSIINEGGVATINDGYVDPIRSNVSAAIHIVLTSAASTDQVIIKGLTLNGVKNTATYGIFMVGAGRLLVDSCIVNGYQNTGAGISSVTQVNIINSIFSNSSTGISIQGGPAPLNAIIANTQVINNSNGFSFNGSAGGLTVMIQDSISTGNVSGAFVFAGSPASIALNRSNISMNSTADLNGDTTKFVSYGNNVFSNTGITTTTLK